MNVGTPATAQAVTFLTLEPLRHWLLFKLPNDGRFTAACRKARAFHLLWTYGQRGVAARQRW